MKRQKPTQTAGSIPTPANVIRMRDPAKAQKPVEGDMPLPVKTVPLWQKWLQRALIVLLACVAFCLIIMLMQRSVLPGGSSAFVQNFAAWFNSHLFPLF